MWKFTFVMLVILHSSKTLICANFVENEDFNPFKETELATKAPLSKLDDNAREQQITIINLKNQIAMFEVLLHEKEQQLEQLRRFLDAGRLINEILRASPNMLLNFKLQSIINDKEIELTSCKQQLSRNRELDREHITNLQTQIGSLLDQEAQLKLDIQERDHLIEANGVTIQEAEQEILKLKLTIQHQTTQPNDELIKEKEIIITKLQEEIKNLTEQKKEDSELISELNNHFVTFKQNLLTSYKQQLENNESAIRELSQNNTNLHAQLTSKVSREKELLSTIEEKDELIEANGVTIQKKESEIEDLKLKTEQKIIDCENNKKALETQLNEQKKLIEDKEEDFLKMQEEMKNLKEQRTTDFSLIEGKNEQIAKFKQLEKYLPNSCPSDKTNAIRLLKVLGIPEPFLADCDSNITGSGWIVIQRRIDESVLFNRTWVEYQSGFGDLQGNYFIGLEKLNLLTQADTYELYIHLQIDNGETQYARYDNFAVGNEKDSYELLSVGRYTGNAGDALSHHQKFKFQTGENEGNCARQYGPWWYIKNGGCGLSALNTPRLVLTTQRWGTPIWGGWRRNVIRQTQMMIRRKNQGS